VDESEDIIRTQRARIENADRQAEFEFIMNAVSADGSARDDFFARLADESNRERETWVLRGLQYLHHPIRAQNAERYLPVSLELLEDIQRTGDIFFPERWLRTTLSGHQSETAATIVREYLATHPELPARLRLKVLQAADGLFRAERVVN
jgi:aminopeptidase N